MGGVQVCKDWGAGGQFKVCEITCNPGLRFSEEVPEFYTCGAEGFWRPTRDPSMPLIYPSCSRKSNSGPLVVKKKNSLKLFFSFFHEQLRNPLNVCSVSKCSSLRMFFVIRPAKVYFDKRLPTLLMLLIVTGTSVLTRWRALENAKTYKSMSSVIIIAVAKVIATRDKSRMVEFMC